MWTVKLFRADHVPSDFREPFIVSGYRSCRSSALSCLQSAFNFTNETINFWTHFLAFVFFAWRLGYLYEEYDLANDRFALPLFTFGISCCAYMLTSSTAHLFNCVSERGRHICFFLDYSALSIYSLGSAIVYNYYVFPSSFVNKTLHNMYIPMACIMAVVCTVLACLSRLARGPKYQKILRLSAFVLPYAFCSFPLLYRCYFCEEEDCSSEALLLHKQQFVLAFMTSFIYATHIPECFAPGRFDIFGHSHQLFHVMGVITTYRQMQALVSDLGQRRAFLLAAIAMPTLGGTLALLGILVFINLIIVTGFSVLVWKPESLHKIKTSKSIVNIFALENGSSKKDD
ncbi:membrane progestin receptor gamma-B-like [Amphiura filiformis]|uniref:membrane progestin receptor gamma-B-like n=1 Tax=Amphiura filiformis TaxID=82378 RepID=UPI003B2220BD